jgi:hypothetical protein
MAGGAPGGSPPSWDRRPAGVRASLSAAGARPWTPEGLVAIGAGLADLSDRIARLQFELLLNAPLDGNLDHLRQGLSELFHDAPDVVAQRFRCRGGLAGLAVFDKGMVDRAILARGVLDRLADADLAPGDGRAAGLLDRVGEAIAPAGTTTRVSRLGHLAEEVLDGAAVLAFAGAAEALGIDVESMENRGISEPKNEPVVLGPQDAFIESAATNLSLVRRRLRTPRLWVDLHRVGAVSRTSVYVLHLHGIADDALVRELTRRLRRIEIDGVVDVNQVKEQIRDTPLSPFPTAQRTERPDRLAAALLEGRVALIVDGSPFAMIVPVTLSGQMKAPEDYYLHWAVSTSIRLVRWAALILGVFLPPLYVAVATFHQEFIPTPLLVTLAASRENVPLPTLFEVLILLFLFEIIREAAARVPQGVGQAVTIGGTLVVGQAIVRAGIISAPVIIVVAAVGIAFFAIPNYELLQTSRLILYPLLLAAGIMGIYGVFFALIGLLLHMASLRSFGVPYLDPVAPLRPANWKDFVLRAPHGAIRTRPVGVGDANPVRARPSPRMRPPRGRP